MAAYIIIAIIAYLIGSINFSVIISKRMAGFDVREKGSGNAGTTNMLRSIGVKAAVITLLCDILKGVVSILIALIIGKIIKDIDRIFNEIQNCRSGFQNDCNGCCNMLFDNGSVFFGGCYISIK